MIVSVSHLSYAYPGAQRPACQVPELQVDHPELVAIAGESGAGKSTFVELLAGTLKGNYEGSVRVSGRELRTLRGDRDRQRYLRTIGLVPQDFALLPGVTVSQLLRQDLRDAEIPTPEHDERIEKALALVGLEERAESVSHQLSGGQRQRVAIARVLARDCALVIADEPTANLDPENASSVLRLLKELARNRVVLLVTHDLDVAAECDRKLTLHAPAGLHGTPVRRRRHWLLSSAAVGLVLIVGASLYLAWSAPPKPGRLRPEETKAAGIAPTTSAQPSLEPTPTPTPALPSEWVANAPGLNVSYCELPLATGGTGYCDDWASRSPHAQGVSGEQHETVLVQAVPLVNCTQTTDPSDVPSGLTGCWTFTYTFINGAGKELTAPGKASLYLGVLYRDTSDDPAVGWHYSPGSHSQYCVDVQNSANIAGGPGAGSC